MMERRINKRQVLKRKTVRRVKIRRIIIEAWILLRMNKARKTSSDHLKILLKYLRYWRNKRPWLMWRTNLKNKIVHFKRIRWTKVQYYRNQNRDRDPNLIESWNLINILQEIHLRRNRRSWLEEWDLHQDNNISRLKYIEFWVKVNQLCLILNS